MAPHLTGISRRELVLHIVLSLSASALIIFMTPISYQLYPPRRVLLEINATAQNAPLSTGNEIGILTASVDGVIIPWSEFSWRGNWDKVGDRPYFHDINPAQLVWQGYARQGLLSLSLISSSSTGILEVNWNGVKHTIDSYQASSGSIKQIDFPVSQKDWRWAVFSLTFTLAIGIFIFIGTGSFRSFFVILLTIGAILINLTAFQKNSQLPPLRSLSTNQIDEVAVSANYVEVPFAAYLYPSLHGATLVLTPELIAELTSPPEMNSRYTAYGAKPLLRLKKMIVEEYDYLLSRDEFASLEQQRSLEWSLTNGGKFVVFPDSEKRTYVIMKYELDALSYYFVPIEIATQVLKRDFK